MCVVNGYLELLFMLQLYTCSYAYNDRVVKLKERNAILLLLSTLF